MELDRYADDLSDNDIKNAVKSVSVMILGGLIGYGVGFVLDNINGLVNML